MSPISQRDSLENRDMTGESSIVLKFRRAGRSVAEGLIFGGLLGIVCGFLKRGEFETADAIRGALSFGVILPLILGVLVHFHHRPRKPSDPTDDAGRTSAFGSRSEARPTRATAKRWPVPRVWSVLAIRKRMCGQCGAKTDAAASRCLFCHNRFSTDEMEIGKLQSYRNFWRFWSWIALASILVVAMLAEGAASAPVQPRATSTNIQPWGRQDRDNLRALKSAEIRVALTGKLVSYSPSGWADADVHEEYHQGGRWRGIQYSRGPLPFAGRWEVQGDELCVKGERDPPRLAPIGRICRSVWRDDRTGQIWIAHVTNRDRGLLVLSICSLSDMGRCARH